MEGGEGQNSWLSILREHLQAISLGMAFRESMVFLSAVLRVRYSILPAQAPLLSHPFRNLKLCFPSLSERRRVTTITVAPKTFALSFQFHVIVALAPLVSVLQLTKFCNKRQNKYIIATLFEEKQHTRVV